MSDLYVATITVSNSNELDCQRMKLTEHIEFKADGNSSNDIKDAVKDVERRFSEIFPDNMHYTMPYTTVEVNKVGIVDMEQSEYDAMTLLKQAYASGQLQGTIIGDKLRDFFGVSYDRIDAEPYSDPNAQTVSLGGQPMYRGAARIGHDPTVGY